MLLSICAGLGRSQVANRPKESLAFTNSQIKVAAILLRAAYGSSSFHRRSELLPSKQHHLIRATHSDDTSESPHSSEEEVPIAPRDDDVLPDSLTDALQEAARATCLAMDRDCQRCIVEILLPEFWSVHVSILFNPPYQGHCCILRKKNATAPP